MRIIGRGKTNQSVNLPYRLLCKKISMKCSLFSSCWECTVCMCGWIISLYCVAFGLSQKCFLRSKKGLHLWGLSWDFHFLETPSVLFCMVPPGTTVLIFLEGMFREPQPPRGKDNGGCDVTSILGASGGGGILGGLDEFWTAFPWGISQYLRTPSDGGLKMAAAPSSTWTPTPAHMSATHSLPSGAVNGLLAEKKKKGKKAGFCLMFPSRVSRQAEEHLHQWGLKWLLLKALLSPQNITWLTRLFDCKYGPLFSLIVKSSHHSRKGRKRAAGRAA